MITELDAAFRAAIDALPPVDHLPPATTAGDPVLALDYFRAQLRSRHLDFAARRLQATGEGFYTIGSAGHESNAAVALALRPTDPALLHYRSGGFYCARAGQVTAHDPVADIVASLTASVSDPISGGRHKVFGHPDLHVIPQTSTIASHLPRAVGLAFALHRSRRIGVPSPWPADAIVVASLGDASLNHSTATGALNAAAYTAYQGLAMPLLVVVEDNGIGISTPTPHGWIKAAVGARPGLAYYAADGADPADALTVARAAADDVRRRRRPAVLHLSTVRLGGHAGSDVELGYRTRSAIAADYHHDPLIATARWLVDAGILTADEVLMAYEAVAAEVDRAVEAAHPVRRLDSSAAVRAPITATSPDLVRAVATTPATDRAGLHRDGLPEHGPELTLAQAINASLIDLLGAHPQALVFGQDVAEKGGVYGVTRGLRNRFGAARVFDTLLDEQTILGTALGTSLAGLLPIPEIQYLAYLHNAEDQLRGEAATLAFFSDGHYSNPMVVRIPGLAYQRGFGGHFHNDNSLAVLRDIPGLVVGCPSSAAEAPGILRTLAGLALAEGRVGVFLEPIALYHSRDLHPGDNAWTAPYPSPDHATRFGSVALHGQGAEVLVVTFGNGVAMSLRAIAETGVPATVLDLRWLAPLPIEELVRHAERFPRIVIADETRRSGGVSEGVITALVEAAYGGRIDRVASDDSPIPLGPAAAAVLLSQEAIAGALLSRPPAEPAPRRR